MTVVKFDLLSPLSPAAAMTVLTDFGPARVRVWPTIDAEHFEVHGLGENWAEVTEGTASAWERARYDWDLERGTVAITTIDSKVFGPGGGWTFRFVPEGTGTRVQVELVRTTPGFKGALLRAVLSAVGASSLKKSFSAPFAVG